VILIRNDMIFKMDTILELRSAQISKKINHDKYNGKNIMAR